MGSFELSVVDPGRSRCSKLYSSVGYSLLAEVLPMCVECLNVGLNLMGGIVASINQLFSSLWLQEGREESFEVD